LEAVDRRAFGERFGLDDFRAMSTAWGLMDWHAQAQFCGRCGAKMEPSPTDERAMKCPKCGHMLFPVICPAMIVAVERDDKLLLAINKMNKTGRYSVLAGFLEVGESIEDAIVREVREEVGVEVERSSIEYLYSQYWPFPRSLMLACRARWKSGELHADGTEIATAGWFAPDEVPQNIPGTITVAGWLIRDFLKRHGVERA
ncbi:MAG: NAD(+) diphosphatase, partial [Pyramidobacter sp.]|nr:NAD(+) diphosphatase [Pyramidobacter sp.]